MAKRQAGSGERIPGRDYCPLDGEPLWMRIQSGGKPQLYIHADRLTWHTDATDKIRVNTWETAAQPSAPEPLTAQVGSGEHLYHMERPGAPDWGGEETDGGEHLLHHAWDSEDGELRLWVGPYEGKRDTGWAVTVEAPGLDVVLRCEPDQILEWTAMVRQAVEPPGSAQAMLREIFTAQSTAPEPSTAEVLAGLREEMAAVANAWGRNHMPTEASAMRNAIALVEAAQQRLAERGRGGGEG